MAHGEPVPDSLYVYAPNKGAPVLFAVGFAASLVGHLWQCYRYKCFKLTWLHPVCATLYTIGYAFREYGAFNYVYGSEGVIDSQNLTIFILSQVFIYISPPLLELANYHILGRLFYYVPYHSPFPAGKVLSTFGALMAVVEGVNAVGVSYTANPSSSQSHQELGSRLTVSALALQLAVIAIFFVLTTIFHRRCAKANVLVRQVMTLLVVLYISMGLILIRCIYRFVEHQGNTTVDFADYESLWDLTPILRYEWFFYVFEASLMLINSVLWNVWHPGRFLPTDYHVYLARDGNSEIRGASKPDDRSIIQKLLAFLTFRFLFRRKETWLSEELDSRPGEYDTR